MTELFQSVGPPDRSARILHVIACLLAFPVGFIGSYSGLFRAGVHSGVGLGFLALATVFGGVGALVGLVIGSNPDRSTVGSTISLAALSLLLGAWMPVVMIFLRLF